jgi:retinol dehydrogenase 12
MAKSNKKGNVVVSIVDPGFVATAIMRNNHQALFNAFMQVWRPMTSRTPKEGSHNLVFAAYGGQDTHGKYLDHCAVGRVAPYIVSEDGVKVQKRLWEELSAKLEEIEPDVMSLV